MPRNGDGSSDNGPIEGHELLHGTSGDTTLQHTKHVAPMPDLEQGEALPGMNASGGAAAPLNNASEQFGTNAPRNEQFGDDETSISRSNDSKTGGAPSSSIGKDTSGSRHSTSKSSSSGAGKSGHSEDNLEQISREKAKKYVNMDEEDVQHAGGPNSKDDVERSSQRAPKDVGPKEGVELLHGKTTLEGDDRSVQSGTSKGSDRSGQQNSIDKSNKQEDGVNTSSGQNSKDKSSKQGGHGTGHVGGAGEDPMRHNAEKFVNLEE